MKVSYNTELLNCPFCNAPPKWTHYPKRSFPGSDHPSRVYEWQSCLSCPNCRSVHFSGFGDVLWEGGNALAQQYAMKRAIEQWNRRDGFHHQ